MLCSIKAKNAEIEIYGSGWAKCEETKKLVKQVVKDMSIGAPVEKVRTLSMKKNREKRPLPEAWGKEICRKKKEIKVFPSSAVGP